MKKIITYGTFDLFHKGHYNILKRARNMGDYLIVGVTSENYDKLRGKLNVNDNLITRIENVKKTNLANEIIIEEFNGQKIVDIKKYNVSTFVIGSDWKGKFDYLKKYCEVIYLERTKGVSSTELRNEKNSILRIGIVGAGRIAGRFVKESKYVSGVYVSGIMTKRLEGAKDFCDNNELEFFTDSYDELLEKVDAVYIATPHIFHYDYIMRALEKDKHVLCEKPMFLDREKVKELYLKANEKRVVLLEAIKTAFSQGFEELITLSQTGVIGNIVDIEACFTKLVSKETREYDYNLGGGSVTELATYPLLPIIKIFGLTENITFNTVIDEKTGVDIYTKILFNYPDNKFATAKIGIGVKSEGNLIISGTKGYIYVPAPWWKTEYFEVRYEDSGKNQKYNYNFKGDGLRYEISEFLSLINSHKQEGYKLTNQESIDIASVIEKYLDHRESQIKGD